MRQFLQRSLVVCKPETKLQYCKTFVRPLAEYSSSVWDPVGNSQLTRQIKVAQGKAEQWVVMLYLFVFGQFGLFILLDSAFCS